MSKSQHNLTYGEVEELLLILIGKITLLEINGIHPAYCSGHVLCHTRLVFQLQVCGTSEATAVGSIGKFSRSFPIEAVKRFAVKMGSFGTGIHELSRRGLLSSLGSSSHSGTTSGLPASPYHTSSDRGGGGVSLHKAV